MSSSGMILCYATAPDEKTAADIARALLAENLIACANLIPGMTALYRWEGKSEETREVVMLLKTREKLWEPLLDRFLEMHPHENPCLVQMSLDRAAPLYLQWLADETRSI